MGYYKIRTLKWCAIEFEPGLNQKLVQKNLILARPDPLFSPFFHSSTIKKITRYCVKPKGKAHYVVVVLGFSAGN